MRFLLRFDALGCAAAAVVAIARDGWTVAILLAVSAVGIGGLSFVPERELVASTRVVALGNFVWAIGVGAALVAGWVEGTDAVLLGLTAPYTLALRAGQLRAARRELPVVSAV